MLSHFSVIAFTHQTLDLADVGQLVISHDVLEATLLNIKNELQLDEIFYIGTCNRVELIMVSSAQANKTISLIVNKAVSYSITAINPGIDKACIARLVAGAKYYRDTVALEHLIRVSCSLESMVVGEKEILAQVRNSYSECRHFGLCGDFLRLIMDQVVKAAKEVYTKTSISQKPISIVSLAYRKLRSFKITLDARIIIVGAGKTNTLLTKYLVKHGFTNFVVFSRTEANACKLAESIGGLAKPLNELAAYTPGFDVMILCTSSPKAVVTTEVYQALLQGDNSRKHVIDLSLPGDLDPAIRAAMNTHLGFAISYIDMGFLQEVSRANLENRYNELSGAESIIEAGIKEFIPVLHQRKIELAMNEIPLKIKEIRERAVDTIFAEDLLKMDENSRKTLDKVLNYMEKKYISVPMVLAKEILVKA